MKPNAAQKAADIQAKSSWQLTFARLVRDPASVISAAVIVLIAAGYLYRRRKLNGKNGINKSPKENRTL